MDSGEGEGRFTGLIISWPVNILFPIGEKERKKKEGMSRIVAADPGYALVDSIP